MRGHVVVEVPTRIAPPLQNSSAMSRLLVVQVSGIRVLIHRTVTLKFRIVKVKFRLADTVKRLATLAVKGTVGGSTVWRCAAPRWVPTSWSTPGGSGYGPPHRVAEPAGREDQFKVGA